VPLQSELLLPLLQLRVKPKPREPQGSPPLPLKKTVPKPALGATSPNGATASQQAADTQKPAAPKTETVAVSGVVLDPDGKAVAGARVIISPLRDKSDASVEVQTGADGKFAAKIEVTPLPAPILAQLPKNIPRPYANALIITPEFAVAGGTLSLIEKTFRLTRGVVASGVVNDADGKPIGGARVRLRGVYTQDDHGGSGNIWLNEKHQDLVSVQSGADGQWKLDRMPLTGTAVFELADDRFALTSAQQELQESGNTLPPLVARPGVTVSGRATYEGGKPAAGIAVSAHSTNRDGEYASAKTADDGTYTLSRLPVGAINITATSEPGDDSSEWVVSSIENLSTQTGPKVTAPDFVLQRGQQLQGTIVDADTKKPLEGAIVGAQGPHGFSRSTPSDKQGRYRVRVLPGSHYLYLYNTPVGYLRNEVNNNVTIAPGQETIAPMLLKKGLTLTGTAVDEEGKPAKGALVRAGRWEGADAIVDDTGNWTLFGVRPGRQSHGEPEGIILLSASGEWHIVSPKQLKVPVEGPVKITLRRIKPASFTGRVRTPQGEPLAGAKVRIKLFLDKEGNSYRTLEKSTDDQGRFTMTQLRPEQSVAVTVSKSGYKYASGGEVTHNDDVFAANRCHNDAAAGCAGRTSTRCERQTGCGCAHCFAGRHR
jgi:protocatechuate 3,4-dioxygenase beta subunit